MDKTSEMRYYMYQIMRKASETMKEVKYYGVFFFRRSSSEGK